MPRTLQAHTHECGHPSQCSTNRAWGENIRPACATMVFNFPSIECTVHRSTSCLTPTTQNWQVSLSVSGLLRSIVAGMQKRARLVVDAAVEDRARFFTSGPLIAQASSSASSVSFATPYRCNRIASQTSAGLMAKPAGFRAKTPKRAGQPLPRRGRSMACEA